MIRQSGSINQLETTQRPGFFVPYFQAPWLNLVLPALKDNQVGQSHPGILGFAMFLITLCQSELARRVVLFKTDDTYTATFNMISTLTIRSGESELIVPGSPPDVLFRTQARRQMG